MSITVKDASGATQTVETLPVKGQADSSASLPVVLASNALAEPGGAPITGASMPAGGVGMTGWLSAIWSKLSGAALESGGNLASIATAAGAPADAAYTSGSGGVIGLLKGIFGKLAGTLAVSWSGQSVGVSSLPALASGSNVVGYVGSLNVQTAPITPTIQAAAYSSTYALGNLQVVPFFRTTGQPSGLLDQFALQWVGGETVPVTVFIFSKNPTLSTFTDKTTAVVNSADAKYLVTAPFVLTAAAANGSTISFAAQAFSLSVKNQDTSATVNLYVAIVAGGAVTPAIGDLSFTLSGALD